MLLAGHSRQQPRTISTQGSCSRQVQSRANMTASNGKGKLDQSQEILSLITRKQPKQFRSCPRVLLAVYQCHKRCGSLCISLTSPANWIFYLRVKRSRQTRSRMTSLTTAFPYVRLGINNKRLRSPSARYEINLSRRCFRRLASKPRQLLLDAWIHPLLAFTLSIYTNCLPFASGINNSLVLSKLSVTQLISNSKP